MRKPRTSLDGRAGLGEAPTTAIVETPVRIDRTSSSLTPSIAGKSRFPNRPPLVEESAEAFDRIGLGEIVDHRDRSERVSLVERPLDLGVERALADRQRRGRVTRDRPGERKGFLERAALRNHAVDETEAFG